jgi:hypothetical protein
VDGCGKSPVANDEKNSDDIRSFEWFLGLLMLLGTLAMSALLGHLQAWGTK